MFANAAHVMQHARRLIRYGMPFYKLASARAMTVLRIRPSFTVEFGRFQIVIKQVSDHIIREKLHAAIGVMDYKPLASSEELV